MSSKLSTYAERIRHASAAADGRISASRSLMAPPTPSRAVGILMRSGFARPVYVREAAPVHPRPLTDLYLAAVQRAVDRPGTWTDVRVFETEANAQITGNCLEGGYLR